MQVGCSGGSSSSPGQARPHKPIIKPHSTHVQHDGKILGNGGCSKGGGRLRRQRPVAGPKALTPRLYHPQDHRNTNGARGHLKRVLRLYRCKSQAPHPQRLPIIQLHLSLSDREPLHSGAVLVPPPGAYSLRTRVEPARGLPNTLSRQAALLASGLRPSARSAWPAVLGRRWVSPLE